VQESAGKHTSAVQLAVYLRPGCFTGGRPVASW